MSLIIDTVQTHLPNRRKTTPSGWTSFNAVCCHHNGTSADHRLRGGIMINEGVSYHCFNCQFKASWQPGRPISGKFKKLLQWLGVPDDLITKCSIEALRLKEDEHYKGMQGLIPTFIDKAMPLGSKPIRKLLDDPPEDLMPVLEYLHSRGFYVDDYDWHWCDEEGFRNRLIIPFMYQGRCVGWTARRITDGKPKYISEQQPGYVFNLDRQDYRRQYAIVCEGPLDAISIDAIALMGAEIKAGQHLLITKLQKEVILVPDRDEAGAKLIQQAIQHNWSVSFPEWGPGIKDINDAVRKYGRLYTLWSIISSKETTALKIQLKSRKWFTEHK